MKSSPYLSAYRVAAQEALETSGELLPGTELKPEGTSFAWRPIKTKDRSFDEATQKGGEPE